MRLRPGFVALALLAACGGANAIDQAVGAADGEDASTGLLDASVGLSSDDAAPASRDGAASSVDASEDARGPDEDAGADGAARADAEAGTADAGSDAGADAAGAHDAGPDAADAGSDSGPPPPPPPNCVEGTSRCSAYQTQVCTAGEWIWQVGDQTCCHDPRFTSAANVVTDSVTGRRWYRYGGRGHGSNEICGAAIQGGRLPTLAELTSLVIGPPVNNKSVCSPTVDQQAFQNVYAGDSTATNGCIDMIRGTSKASCSDDVGFMCTID